MTGKELKKIVECGETSFVQFKRTFSSQKEIAKEIVAFANGEGGRIIFGIDDKTGDMIGLKYDEAQWTNNELGNTANEQIKPTIYVQTETVKFKGKLFVICNVPRGKDKPYKNVSGEIWVKQGADKRRVTENNEILSLFQDSGKYKPELSPLDGTSLDDLDLTVVEEYFVSAFGKRIADFEMPLEKLLQSQKIINGSDNLTVAGALFFSKMPQLLIPWFVVKAVAYEGNHIGGSTYRDSKDIVGRLPKMLDDALSFMKANLHYVQNGQNFNKTGVLEIPEVVLEEVLQNALIHLDINSPAAIRLLIFDDRVEIINSGSLYEGIGVDDIKLGVSKQRNPQMAILGTRTMIYKGLGSGIPRILKENVRIDFENQPDANQFKVIIWRISVDKIANSVDKSDKSSDKIANSVDKSDKSSDKIANSVDKSDKSSDKIANSVDKSDKSSDKIANSVDKSNKSVDKKEYIIQYVLKNGSIATKDVREILNISESYAKKLLSSLVNDGKLQVVGANKNRRYTTKAND